ncbi:DUF255 domain-containing protein [Pelagicoccus sp. SDUM812003]|uniref:DUF255 domain-containing protein n=1 Tax=Pelagicoccus sp. SDUM812003 TaxID=3041267 RepID=UPI00280F41A0|nr:DUF255 domain-containing protein [Pelagicoccus sp. SDUM812003]MDQ8205180.1 DUF255 domain-containing protein [Pelagicoccus sp. SDUM812003]
MTTLTRFLILTFTTLCLGASSLVQAQTSFIELREGDPVNWQPWSEDLLTRAEQESKPLFFFVAHFGNSLANAMGHETFQNQTIAKLVNETTIPVLVDSTQTPELAAALLGLASEHFQTSGWPVCIWTTSALAPLEGGGYFPPTDDWGSQGFLTLARNVSEKWNTQRDEFVSQAKQHLESSLATLDLTDATIDLTQALDYAIVPTADAPALSSGALASATQALPLLPDPAADRQSSEIASLIETIYAGAGFDPISGGFFIGANDPSWRLPLFQKSAADQALMLSALARLYETDPKDEYKNLIRLTAMFVDRELKKKNGLAHEYLDSFAPGETPDMIEGSYYLLEDDDISDLSPDQLGAFGLASGGNLSADIDILGLYQGLNIAYSPEPTALSPSLDAAREALQAIRAEKKAPRKEATAFVSTNALLVEGLAAAAAATDESSLRTQAIELYASLLKTTWRAADATLANSDLQDASPASSAAYARLISASLALLELTGQDVYLENAKAIDAAWRNDARFDPQNRLTLAVSGMDTKLPLGSYIDSSRPAVASVHLRNLSKLASKTGDQSYLSELKSHLSSLPSQAEGAPDRYLSLLVAAESIKRQ